MEQSNRSATLKISRLLWHATVYYHIQKKAADPISSKPNPLYSVLSYLTSTLIIFYHLHLGLPSIYFRHGYRPKFCIHFSALPYVLHSPTILSYSTSVVVNSIVNVNIGLWIQNWIENVCWIRRKEWCDFGEVYMNSKCNHRKTLE